MEDELLTTKEAAAFLGISMDQLYKLNSARRIPNHSPTGGKVYYLKSELLEWVLAGRRATDKDIEFQSIKSLHLKNKCYGIK